MKSLLLFVVIATSTDFVQLEDTNTIENSYIDILVQHYFLRESDLWDFIYNSGVKSKDIIFKIRTSHRDFLSSHGFSDIMNNDYKSKFERFLNLTEYDNYYQEDSVLLALLEQLHGYNSGFYEFSDTVIRNYNRVISEDLFKILKDVSK